MGPIYAELASHLSESDLTEVRAVVAGIEQRIVESQGRFGGRGSGVDADAFAWGTFHRLAVNTVPVVPSRSLSPSNLLTACRRSGQTGPRMRKPPR